MCGRITPSVELGDIENQEVSGIFRSTYKGYTPSPKGHSASRTSLQPFSGNVKDHYIGKFPWINDSVTYAEFKLHERSYFDAWQCIIPSAALVVAWFTRFNLYTSTSNGVYFDCSLICILLFTAM